MTTPTNNALDATPTWHLTGYQDFNYLDSNLSGLRFTQGIVWNPDAGEWISTWQYGMARLTPDLQFLQTTGSYDLSTFEPISAIPQALADLGLDHIGDIDYDNGKLYVALDNSELDYTTGYVAIFNASDLSYTGTLYELVGAPSNPHNDVASWVTIDAEAGLGYGKEYQSGNTINIYNLDDWSFQGTLEMDQSLKSIQGAKVMDGVMYMSSDNSTQSIYSLDLSTGHVEELFHLPSPDNTEIEVEGIEAKKNSDGNVELTVELIIDPDGDIYGDTYSRVFTYTLDSTSTDVALHHTWTVNTASDDTNANDLSLTLREAIAKADDGDTVTFYASMAGQTITLADAELALSKNITIEGDLDGDGKSDITIDGGDLSSVVHVTGGTATLDGLVILHGADKGSSVSIDDGATLAFTNGATANLETEGDDGLAGTTGFDAIHGDAGDDIIMGLGGNDKLYGDAGNDILIGGAGTDTLVGGEGDDTYIVSDDGDVVTELNAGGKDIVKASFSYTLGDYVENLTLTGTDDLNGNGNDLANVLAGNSGANSLSGLADNDKLSGREGDDTLQGGSGNDTLDGGTGKDALWGGAGADRFIFALGDTSTSKANADTIFDLRGNQGDLIDLHAIDANEGKGSNQAFSFIGADKFSGHAGELRYEKTAGDTYIYGDTDGDKKADFTLHLDDAMSLKHEYFVL
ncbi:MAG: hypothetical protein JWM58_1761 [Rhizobium sp.]|nr:hypothetical protein [Rhizobium sp.]